MQAYGLLCMSFVNVHEFVYVLLSFWLEGGMWDLIVLISNNCISLNSHSFFLTFRHNAFIKIMKFVRDYIFECLHYSQDSNMESRK